MITWESIVQHFERYYFTTAILWLAELIAIIIAIRNVRDQKIGRYFIFYLLFDFSILTIDLIYRSSAGYKNRPLIYYTFVNSSVAIIEFVAYSKFFSTLFFRFNKNQIVNKVLGAFFIITIIHLILILALMGSLVIYITTALTVIEFLILMSYCLLYYYHTLNQNLDTEFSKTPSLWIVTGIFTYALVSIPYYLLVYYFYTVKYTYNREVDVALSIIPFTLNFLFLSKAFSLKKMLTWKASTSK